MAQEQPINYNKRPHVCHSLFRATMRMYRLHAQLSRFISEQTGSSGLPGNTILYPGGNRLKRFKLIDVSDVTTAPVMYNNIIWSVCLFDGEPVELTRPDSDDGNPSISVWLCALRKEFWG